MELFSVNPGSSLPDLQGSTLLVPAVASGNVGELSMDILIASLKTSLVGYLENDNILPCVGNDPHNMNHPGTLSTALELYKICQDGVSIYLMQQRAPAILGRQAEFAESLVEWAQAQGVSRVIILSGLDASLRQDKQIMGPATRYLADSAPELACMAEEQSLLQLEQEYLVEERHAHGRLPPWPMLAATSRRGLPHLLLGCFAAEGDNLPHALVLAQDAVGMIERICGSQLIRVSGGAAVASVPSGCVGLTLPCSFSALYGSRGGADASFFG